MILVVCFIALTLVVELLCRSLALPDPYYNTKKVVNSYIPLAKPAGSKTVVRYSNHPWHKFENDVIICYNDIGCRGENVIGPKKPDELRVGLLGGSFIVDTFHSDDECIYKLLEKELQSSNPNKKITMICFSSGGETPADLLAMLVQRIIYLEMDALVYMPTYREFMTENCGIELTPSMILKIQNVKQQIRTEWVNPMLLIKMMLASFHIWRALSHIFKNPDRHTIYLKGDDKYFNFNFNVDFKQAKDVVYVEKVKHKTLGLMEKHISTVNAISSANNIKVIVAAAACRWTTSPVPLSEEPFYTHAKTFNGKEKIRQHVLGKHYHQYVERMELFCKARSIPFVNLNVVDSNKFFWIDDWHLMDTSKIIPLLSKAINQTVVH